MGGLRSLSSRVAVALLFSLAWAAWPGPAPAGVPLAGVPLGATVASAGDEWCEVDPLVTVVTPRGNRLDVHVTNFGLGAQYLPLVEQASITYSVATPKGRTGTQVKVDVLIPKGTDSSGKDVKFPTRSVVSSGEHGQGVIYARGEGQAGSAIKMEFYIPLP
jgi:hypothetical protein